MTPPSFAIDIRTTYGPEANPSSPSGYGRGTTQVDRNAGNTTLGFHEGTHGTATQEYLRANPPPVFETRGITTEAQLNQRARAHKDAMTTYVGALLSTVRSSGDCVGPTQAPFCAPPQLTGRHPVA